MISFEKLLTLAQTVLLILIGILIGAGYSFFSIQEDPESIVSAYPSKLEILRNNAVCWIEADGLVCMEGNHYINVSKAFREATEGTSCWRNTDNGHIICEGTQYQDFDVTAYLKNNPLNLD